MCACLRVDVKRSKAFRIWRRAWLMTQSLEVPSVWVLGRAQHAPHRISARRSSMARCSACLTAICRRSDSQEHSG